MEGENVKKKGPIELDWSRLLPAETSGNQEEEEQPQVVVVVPAKRQQSAADEVNGYQHDDQLGSMKDRELKDTLERLRRNLPLLLPKLKDGGEKFRANIKRHEVELERRQRLRLRKDDNGCEKPLPVHISNCFGASSRAPLFLSSSQSKFASCFFDKLDKKTDSTTLNAFEKELSTLNRCENLKMGSNGQFLSRGRQKRRWSSRETPFQSPGNLCIDVEKHTPSNSDGKGRGSSACSSHHPEEMSAFFPKRTRASQVEMSNCTRNGKGEPVVLVDEDELELNETMSQSNDIDECLSRNTRIFYPSRDDPEAVEISYSDINCLAPEGYLSSTIMNFYIRFLQELISPTYRERYNYHFFNTYFYEKLKEAVVNKNITETSFVKFRRWWKGVNIFEKAYILMPIHDSLHWSLVIICIPDKEDGSGPILLHLDSLRLHSSHSIFCNLKRFLIEEWKFLKEKDVLGELPIADKIWEKLPRRIDERVIEVPQQRNDYDCGLFVLFFMKRFIEEAPERLKKNDLAMFGKKWFNPEEASSLRQKIRNLLKERFKDASEEYVLDS